MLRGATFVASYGRFTQAPDYQFLVDAAFDDTTRTGRFRQGNPDLGFERASQYELSVRIRPREAISLRLGVFQKRLTGLVASVPLGLNPDSTIFGNADAGTARGFEVLAERDLVGGFGFRVSYALQDAKATSTDPFLLNRLIVVNPQTGDTTRPARAEFPLDFDQRHTLTVILRGKVPSEIGPRILGVRPVAGLEGCGHRPRALRTPLHAERHHRGLAGSRAQQLAAPRHVHDRSAAAAAAAPRRGARRDLSRRAQPARPAERGGRAPRQRDPARDR